MCYKGDTGVLTMDHIDFEIIVSVIMGNQME